VSWPLVKLSKLVEINIGRTPSRSNDSYWGRGYPWLSIADMSQGSNLAKTKEQITELALKETKPNLAPKGTVLFSFKLSIGKVGITDVDMYHNEAIASFPIKDRSLLCTEYLVYALQSLDYLASTDRAVMGATLNNKKLAELLIPLPPLPVQKQIAAVLEKADTLRSQCQQMEQELNSLAQSVFLDMFGDPVTNPKDWPQKPSKELCRLITVGIVIKPSSYYVDAGIPALRSLNVRENYISNENFVYFDKKVHEQKLKKTHVYEGDVVIVRSGQPGRSSVIPKKFDGANAIDILITRPNSDLLNSFYFSFFLNSEGGKQLVLSNEKGQVQKHLNVGELSRALIPVPPITLQNEFEGSLNKLAVQMRLNKDLLTNCDDNFNSLMQRAFKGELDLKDVA
jgi:type I restriction enzyme S subunit